MAKFYLKYNKQVWTQNIANGFCSFSELFDVIFKVMVSLQIQCYISIPNLVNCKGQPIEQCLSKI